MRLAQGGFPAFHWVDQVVLDFFEAVRADFAGQAVDGGGPDERAVLLGEELDALGGGVGPLVVLPRQRFDREDGGSGLCRGLLVMGDVAVRFRQYAVPGGGVFCVADAGEVIAFQDAKFLQFGEAEVLPQVRQQLAGLDVKAGALFNK